MNQFNGIVSFGANRFSSSQVKLFGDPFIMNGGDIKSVTQLHYAAGAGQLLLLHSLVKEGANVNIRTADGYTPLHEACRGSQVYCAKNLIKAGADVNLISCYYESSLHLAAGAGSADCVRLLLESGAEVSSEHKDTMTPLHYAVLGGSLECCQLLTEAKCSLTEMDTFFGTPLHAAVMENTGGNRLQCTHHLLHKGANPNTTRPRDLQTPLHEAASKDEKEMVELLLSYNANPHLRDGKGRKPIELSTAGQPTAMVLQEYMRNTERLSSLCRHSIRTTLGNDANKSIRMLPLPDTMKDYLCYRRV